MLIPQGSNEADRRQGSRGPGFAELRRHVAAPSKVDDGHRQRLLELARRLARVQSLGDEYSRVELSEYVTAALRTSAAVA